MIKPPLVTFCSILGIFTIAPAFAGSAPSTVSNSVQGVAEREIVRRQEAVGRARAAMAAGDKAMADKDYEVAVVQYKNAVDLLPESASTRDLRRIALHAYCHASVRLAEQRIAEGRFGDAEAVAKAVLEDRYDPHCKEALLLLSHLEEPDYYNKTITPKFHANVEQVKQWFVDAQGFYDTGRYDLAEKRYQQILNIDPYNSAARKGLEKIDNAKEQYGVQAYDQTRSHLIWELTKGWELPVRRYGGPAVSVIEQGAQPQNNTVAITNKLNRLIIPKVEFHDATVREAVEFLKHKSYEIDTAETDPARRGVNIVLQLEAPGGGMAPAAPAALPTESGTSPVIGGLTDTTGAGTAPVAPAAPVAPIVNPADARITLSLTNVPLAEVLRYITNLAGLKLKIDPYAVAIVPITTITEQIITKEYKVPPSVFTASASSGATDTSAASVTSSRSSSGGGGGGGTGGIAKRIPAKDLLSESGVQFPPGANATFLPSSSKLIVRNTQENLDLVDTIVEAWQAAAPTQVEIESKFVEIQQNNLKELSFDWLLGQFNIPGSNRVFGGGGTSGNGNQISSTDFPFNFPGGGPVGTNAVTAGNRTGSGAGGAISANAIDALLFPAASGATSAAPGIFSMSGVFTDPQFQVVIRALNQKKGIDLLSAPRVTTKSGQHATIEVIREFRYPTEFNPPQIPQTVGATTASTGVGGVGGSVSSVPITPTTPTAFETRNTGVTLEVEPVVGPDGATIDLTLSPQVTEFEGFINYGSPILSPAQPSILDPLTGLFTQAAPQSVVTPNVINQPIFSTRKVQTSVTIWDGQTVVLGGLMREDVQKVEDKVPLLGDVPFAGRLFRSSVDQHLKTNLVIFVTARLINPAGEPVNGTEEKEEVVETVGAPTLPPEVGLPTMTK